MWEVRNVSPFPQGLGTYSSPNRKCVSETRVGIGSGRDFISCCFRNSAGEAYRLQYTYFSNLVARTRLPPLAAPQSEAVRIISGGYYSREAFILFTTSVRASFTGIKRARFSYEHSEYTVPDFADEERESVHCTVVLYAQVIGQDHLTSNHDQKALVLNPS